VIVVARLVSVATNLVLVDWLGRYLHGLALISTSDTAKRTSLISSVLVSHSFLSG
jgi:hypothetical protein